MVVAVPDHNHAVVTMAAIERGKHVYCEKPLTYSVHEARQVTEAARRVSTKSGSMPAVAVSELVRASSLTAGS